MVEEVAVDGDLDALDGERRDLEPARVDVAVPARRARVSCRNTMSVTTPVPSRLKASDGRRIAPRKSARVGEVLADRGVLLVERVVRRDQGQDAAGLQGVERLREEEVVEREPLCRGSSSFTSANGGLPMTASMLPSGSLVSRKFSMRMSWSG